MLGGGGGGGGGGIGKAVGAVAGLLGGGGGGPGGISLVPPESKLSRSAGELAKMLAMAPPSCPGEAKEFGQEAEEAIDLGNKIHELEEEDHEEQDLAEKLEDDNSDDSAVAKDLNIDEFQELADFSKKERDALREKEEREKKRIKEREEERERGNGNGNGDGDGNGNGEGRGDGDGNGDGDGSGDGSRGKGRNGKHLKSSNTNNLLSKRNSRKSSKDLKKNSKSKSSKNSKAKAKKVISSIDRVLDGVDRLKKLEKSAEKSLSDKIKRMAEKGKNLSKGLKRKSAAFGKCKNCAGKKNKNKDKKKKNKKDSDKKKKNGGSSDRSNSSSLSPSVHLSSQEKRDQEERERGDGENDEGNRLPTMEEFAMRFGLSLPSMKLCPMCQFAVMMAPDFNRFLSLCTMYSDPRWTPSALSLFYTVHQSNCIASAQAVRSSYLSWRESNKGADDSVFRGYKEAVCLNYCSSDIQENKYLIGA